jgi:hypothetical protein
VEKEGEFLVQIMRKVEEEYEGGFLALTIRKLR